MKCGKFIKYFLTIGQLLGDTSKNVAPFVRLQTGWKAENITQIGHTETTMVRWAPADHTGTTTGNLRKYQK